MVSLPNSLIEGWQPSPTVDKWARKNGFGEPHPATDRELREFSRRHSGAAPGLYLWEDSEHHIYIGISEKHVVARLRSHVRNFLPVSNIQSFRYRAMVGTSNELRDVERNLVHAAVEDKSQFVVMNREHAAMVVGDSVFDEEVPADEQVDWLDDPLSHWHAVDRSRAAKQSNAAEKAWLKFDSRLDSEAIVDAVALYLRLCVPHAAATEYRWWVVTCPGWKAAEFERVCTVNMSFLEMLWFYENRDTGQVSVAIGTDFQFLPSLWENVKLRMIPLGKLHKSGGPFEEVIAFESVADFVAALNKSAALRRGAARFALDRMRRGKVSGRFQASHSPQLATAVLKRASEIDVKRLSDDKKLTRLKTASKKLGFKRAGKRST